MDNLSVAQRDIFAIKIVLQNVIALMGDVKQDVLKEATVIALNEMISSSSESTAFHLEEIKKSAMRIIEVGIAKAE